MAWDASEPNLNEYLACPVALVACPISEPLAIWDVYRMEEFFIGEDLFVSLLKETALEVILFLVIG